MRFSLLNKFKILILGSTLFFITSCHEKAVSPFSKSAIESLSTFELPPGFKIELIAAEPLISDPVDMTIDEQGRMYVVEMHGYPLDLNHTGKVILLTDTDGDGKMDTRTIFADSLTLPTGVMRWKKGIIVTDAPNVYYFEDTTGDGKADIKKIMLTGFALTNPQYLVNNPIYGLDNWIYLAHEGREETNIYPKKFGDSGKDIFYPNDSDGPHLPVNASGRIVRFQPDKNQLEEASGATQFGHTFDAWGHHFLVANDNHIFQEVIANRYLKRNPEQVIGNATQSLSDHGDACEVFPITKNPENQLLTDVGVITSACGIIDYQGGAFPQKFNHDLTFVCEPVSNLIHADRLKNNGASFIAGRILEQKDFLASIDAWFRPVNLYIGPDGALYVVDYYREIIEHPEWMSEEAVKSGKLYNGIDKGRIYRISAEDASPVTWTKHLDLDKATGAQLVEKLADPNIWWRRNAQRLLVDRNDPQTIISLISMAQNQQYPLGHLHALWTLEGMNKLPPSLILLSLSDPVPGMRENAIKLAELHLNEDSSLINSLLNMENDPDDKVRYQLLCTLGSVNTPEADAVRQKLLLKDINDKWVQIAALSASSSHSVSMLNGILGKFNPDIPAFASLVQRLGAMVSASQSANTIRSFISRAVVVDSMKKSGWQAPLLDGIAEGLGSNSRKSGRMDMTLPLLINTCLKHPDLAVRKGARHILQSIGVSGHLQLEMMQQAKNLAANDKLTSDERAEAIHLLALGSAEKYAAFLKKMIVPGMALNIQMAAMSALAKIPDATVSSFAINHWVALPPDVKNIALNTFITEPFNEDRIRLLLNAIETGRIQKSFLGWPRTVILMRDIPEALKTRARALLADNNRDRKTVVKEYESALKLKGDAAKGKTIYQANCLICHQINGKLGVAFGPDLGTIKQWSAESIMINIIDPDRSISHGYEMWSVTLQDGTTMQGIISAETPNAIILRKEGGIETTLARRNIKSMSALGMSAMPVGFENKISRQQMADLLAFLRQNK